MITSPSHGYGTERRGNGYERGSVYVGPREPVVHRDGYYHRGYGYERHHYHPYRHAVPYGGY